MEASELQLKIQELTTHGYINNFTFENGKIHLEKDISEEEHISKDYVAEQVSVEAEYFYEEQGTALIAFMTFDGEQGYAIDKRTISGEYPLISYIESVDD